MGRIGSRALASLSAAELNRAVAFAVTCATFTCGRRGADPPRLSEVGGANAGFG
jgi:fructokinase